MTRTAVALSFAIACIGAMQTAPAQALEKLTYLTAAPPILPAFGPYQIAKYKGYYRDAGLDVDFVAAKGGADIAKQLGAGNAEMGGGIGDTPVIVRPNGVPARAVALMGGRALTQIVVRQDSGIKSPADLKGKVVTVLSYQDTTYYALLGVLSKFHLTKNDVDAEAVGPAGMIQLVVAGKAPALAGVPERGIAVEAAGVPVRWFAADDYFPCMAPAILASDQTIQKKPEMVRSFVRATLHGMRDIMADPVQAARDFVAGTPENTGKEAQIAKVFRAYDERVYPGQKVLGAFDAERMKAVQDFYLEAGIIRSKTPLAELYTNEFVQ